ncbi:hypothetical protein ABZX40_10290 [Streptomyces sp. NPDC004610]|uniref:hypothetical protein n=1 Tax=unclassified Streptomyces TaxID=2593676 RepID=UPI0033B5F69F
MNDKQTITNVRDNPGGYGLNQTYYATAMFLTGVDLGRSGGLLRGFTEWLVVRRGECSSFYWHKQVLLDLFPDERLVGDWREPDHLTPAQNREAVDHLCSLVLAFLEVRDSSQKLSLMYKRFAAMHAHIWD